MTWARLQGLAPPTSLLNSHHRCQQQVFNFSFHGLLGLLQGPLFPCHGNSFHRVSTLPDLIVANLIDRFATSQGLFYRYCVATVGRQAPYVRRGCRMQAC